MKNQITTRIIYPDGGERAFVHQKDVQCDDFSIELHAEQDVYTVTLTPLRDGLALNAVECEAVLPLSLQHLDQLYFYDNDITSNDRTYVYPFIGHENRVISELAVFKNLSDGESALCGLLTAHRFWSRIRIRVDAVKGEIRAVFRFEMENRLLQTNEPYIMERFMVSGGRNQEHELLQRYAQLVADINHAIPTGEIPVGWCSWSCYFSDVDEEKVRRAADAQVQFALKQANLIQIDDGWQRGGTFGGGFHPDEGRFPSGLPAMGQYVRDRNMAFGLWLAPLLIDDQSPDYDELKALSKDAITFLSHCHPFELGDPLFLEHLRKLFRRLVDEYGATYFKLDFLLHAVRYMEPPFDFVRFRDGFCMEVLRKALWTIRETVGDDVYLLACGTPMLPCVGIFNGSRMSCDIIWGRGQPYWELMRDCTKNVTWRNFYNGKVFINDADGLVTRDVDNGDGFNCTYSEAELWAIAVAASGGAILSNDELENLSPGRRRLYTKLLPPLGIAARPVDMFQQPCPDAAVIDYDESVKFLALYNFTDEMKTLTFDLRQIGLESAFAADCLHGKSYGVVSTVTIPHVNPHGAVFLLLRRVPDKPVFAWSDANIFGGINVIRCTFDGDTPVIQRADGYENAKVYLLFPDGHTQQA